MNAVSDHDAFNDVVAGNRVYSAEFALGGLEAHAERGLAIVTCMDSRMEPPRMLGLMPGDAKVLRNAGARVTEDVLRSLVLAHYLLGVDRAIVIAHTDCRMAKGSEEDVHEAVRLAGGPDTRSLEFAVTSDQEADLRADAQRIRSSPYLSELRVGGFLYDVRNGSITRIC